MFQSGQKVICINDEFAPWVHRLYRELPKLGHIYTVRDVRPGHSDPSFTKGPDGKLHAKGNDDIAITVVELVNPPDPFSKYGEELGFKAERFQDLEEDSMEEHESEGAALETANTRPAASPGR